MRIVLCFPAEPHHLDAIARAAPAAEIIDAGQTRIASELPTADIFCGHAKVPVPWDAVVHQGRLRWIQSTASGVDHCLVPSVVESDILVTSVSGVLADQVAEHTIALLTGLLRSMPDFYRAQQARQFDRLATGELHYRRVGIVGLGGVGRRLAELLAVFHTRIVATDWCPVDRPDHVEALWPPDRLADLLAFAEIVILCAPLNQHTRGMLDARAMAQMGRGSILVNVARGPLVVTDDLIAALDDGHLAGAALDVTEPEPLPPASRLWDFPNVVITPHVGGQASWRYDRITAFFCDNLVRYRNRQSLRNLVDKHLGFPLRAASCGDVTGAGTATDQWLPPT
ncbi:MAG: phosphoglycerate dehydrogenase [Planctomycetes bacterium RBG_16_64_10]|nr:MAG: phosphoglycerate dehydrogenase [Planctomycetes bacterium RBG_16_64_10]